MISIEMGIILLILVFMGFMGGFSYGQCPDGENGFKAVFLLGTAIIYTLLGLNLIPSDNYEKVKDAYYELREEKKKEVLNLKKQLDEDNK